MEVDEKNEKNDEFKNVNLIEDVVFYLQEKVYRADCTKNWKRSGQRKAKKFEIIIIRWQNIVQKKRWKRGR